MTTPLRYRILQWRLWFVEHFYKSEMPVILFWAGFIGFGGGILSVLFRKAIRSVQWFLTHQNGTIVEASIALSKWERLFIPSIGGLIAGSILYFGMRLNRRQETTDYMEALVVGDGNMGTRPTLAKSLSSLFTIASGGAVGREGPMVTLSAMFAFIVGKIRHFSIPRLKLMIACGAAAGIAAAYNAPIAGALFVAEIILGTISMELFGPLVFSSAVSVVTVHQLLGAAPTYDIPSFRLISNWELPLYILLGLVAGTFSPVFLSMLKNSQSLFTRLRLPIYIRMMLGGLIVGIISTLRPEVWGNGYSVVNSILVQDWLWPALLTIFVCKLLAVSSTVGSGAVGGVFTPTLFVGAVLGCLYGKAAHFFAPGLTTMPGGYALVGMGCFLAATTQAPLMAILMIFEMTLQYEVVLPLMLGCVSAHYVSRGLGQDSIYAGHLKRKQEEIKTPQKLPQQVSDLMKQNPPSVSLATTFGEIANIFSTHRINNIYVTDSDGHFRGVVSLHEMKPYLNDPLMANLVIAMDFMREDFPVLNPQQDLTEALRSFTSHDGERIPVVDHNRHLIGTISKTDLLLSIAESPKP